VIEAVHRRTGRVTKDGQRPLLSGADSSAVGRALRWLARGTVDDDKAGPGQFARWGQLRGQSTIRRHPPKSL